MCFFIFRLFGFKFFSWLHYYTMSVRSKKRRENEIKKMHEKVIEHFLLKRDVPAWYRAGSEYQIKAVERLFHSIRDDAEQKTIHRTRDCLEGLGIWPMVSSKEMEEILHLSRGSDLAYLWFLWELHYKTPGKKYDYNEQLLFTGIAHLDTITTLRELDRIMPPGHPSKKVLEYRRKKLQEKEKMEKQRQKQEQRKKNKEESKEKKPKKNICGSPYFRRLERQKPYGKSLTVDPPDFSVNFSSYLKYKNPNYIVPNESNRWFTNFMASPGARVCKSVIDDEIDLIFGDLRDDLMKGVTHSILNVITRVESVSVMPTKENTVLCTHHWEEEERIAREQLKQFIIKRDLCLKSLEGNSYKKKMHLKRILDELEKNIESYRKTLRPQVKAPEKQNQVNIIGKECFCEYTIPDPGDDEEECHQPDLYLCVNEEGEVARVSSCTKVNQPNDPESQIKYGEQERLRGGAEAEGITIKKPNMDEVPKNVISGTAEHRKSNVSIASNTQYHETRQNSEIDTSELPEQFFIPPQKHKPYEFDYRKVFKFITQNDEEKLKLKRLILDALDSDEKDVKKLLDDSPDIMDAIKKWVLKTWKDLMVIQREKEIEAEKRATIKDDEQLAIERAGVPMQDFYDCDDSNLMSNMLKAGLRFMSRNPKYVLASLEDSHKLPILREWIVSRYGKTYTQAERIKSYTISNKVFSALARNPPSVKNPPLKLMGSNVNNLDYSCYRYVARKANRIKQRYRHQLSHALMEHSRNFWFALRPYLCGSGPPRKAYYSYIPARVRDIHYFRPWKPNEFRNVKLQWENRQAAKSRKERLPG